MEAKDELLELLHDTKRWASTPANIDTDSIYRAWPSHSALLAELDSHLADAGEGLVDFSKLYVLYAPTAGLCEIVTSDASATTYMNLAARFDTWYASVKPHT